MLLLLFFNSSLFSKKGSFSMECKKIKIRNFRNIGEAEITFDDGVNILTGANAQGKTNCAEAVFYLCTGTSLRIKRDKQLIRIGEEKAKIIAEAENRYGTVTIDSFSKS